MVDNWIFFTSKILREKNSSFLSVEDLNHKNETILSIFITTDIRTS